MNQYLHPEGRPLKPIAESPRHFGAVVRYLSMAKEMQANVPAVTQFVREVRDGDEKTHLHVVERSEVPDFFLG